MTIDGAPAVDGIEIYAEIVRDGAVYATLSALTSGGSYSQLKVEPPSILFDRETVTFYAWIDGAGVAAAETVPFNSNVSLLELLMTQDLTFTTTGS